MKTKLIIISWLLCGLWWLVKHRKLIESAFIDYVPKLIDDFPTGLRPYLKRFMPIMKNVTILFGMVFSPISLLKTIFYKVEFWTNKNKKK